MNGLFFLLPFILVASLGIYQDSFAVESYRGDTWLDVTNPDNSHTQTLGLSPFIETGQYDNKWRKIYAPYILEETPTQVKFESGNVSWIFNKDSCTAKLYNTGKIDVSDEPMIESLSWTLQEEVSGTWENTVHNTMGCNVTITELPNDTISLIAKQGNDSVGYKEIEFRQKGGEHLESFMRSPVSDGTKKYGFNESHIKTQDVIHGNKKFGLEILNEQKLQKTEFKNNRGKDIPIIITKTNHPDMVINLKDSVHGTLTDATVKKYSATKLQTYYDFHNTSIIPSGQRLEIDPTYSSNDPTVDGFVQTTAAGTGTSCASATYSTNTSGVQALMYLSDADTADECYRSFFEWNTSTINDSATITNTVFKYNSDITAAVPNCDYNQMTQNGLAVGSMTAAQLWTEIGDGTTYLSNDATCHADRTPNLSVDLGTTADSDVQTLLASDRFAVGVKLTSETRSSVSSINASILTENEASATPKPTLEVTYTFPACTPDAPTSAIAGYSAENTITISWVAPTNCLLTYQAVEVQESQTGLFDGEETTIYSSTPVLTVDDTVPNNEFHFYRIAYQSHADEGSLWGEYGLAETQFTAGSINVFETNNPIELPISFVVNTLDVDTSNVTVTYDSTYDLACDFRYALGMTNTTYTGLTETVITGTSVYTNFTVNGIDNDIIDIYCWDQLDNSTDGSERIGQNSVPLFDQINNFQNGVFGTDGKFGALDLMSLIIVIISMIAFNRSHPYVGVLTMVAMFAVAGWYGLVQPITVMSGFLILIVALAIAYGRREGE